MASTLDLSGYKLTFDEEFNSFSWSADGRPGTVWKTTYQGLTRTLSNNGEKEYYSDATVGVHPFSIVDGALRIEAKPSSGNPLGLPYTSGVITTENSFAQQYGYFEMRAQLPEGQGLWPAFWLLAADKKWPPEIDPLEGFGNKPNAVHTGAISGNGAESFGQWNLVPADITTGYHTYGLLWTPTELVYYFDGEEIARGKTPSDMHKPMYLLANLAVGGNWPGVPDGSTEFPAHMNIDYIRVYSNDPKAVAVAQQPVSTPDADWVTKPAAPHSAAPVEGGAPTRTASGNTGTSGNDLFNNVYGDTATRTGGAGDDTYVVADDRLKIVEKPGEGIDSLRLWIDYRLPENVENARVEAPWGLSVNGNALSNIIAGGAGDDVINGRGGDDLLSGGGGSDVFIVTAGNGYDTITDFKPGTDRLVLDGYGLKNFAAVQAAMTMVGGDTVLTLDNGETVTFKGVAKSAFTAADFRFTSVTKGGAADPTPSPDPDPTPDPDPVPAPGGNNVLKLRVAEDAYQGDAQFKVLVDGKQFGSVQTVTARHGAGQWQELTLTGDIGSGSHKIEIVYLNDLYGGSTAADRNLYVDWIELDGNRVEAETGTLDPALGAKWGGEVLIWSNGTLAFNNVAGAAPDPTPSPEPDPTPAPDPDPAPVPGGNNVLKLRVAEDAYQGDAQFKVLVDGKQFGGVQTVTARHGAGQWQELTLTGDIGGGSHKIEIVYLNDLYGGSTAADRNLYVDWIELDGNRVEAETGTLDPALGAKRGGEALLWSNGTLAFNNVAGAAPDPTPGPEPDPTPAPGPDPAPGTGPVIVNPAARPTPDIARSYVGPDSTGTARGTAKAEDIFASAEGQTLIGGGGDDVFHVGSFSNVRIVVPESGITTVSTWATRHTLADGVDNLVLQGNYAHDVRGNALANTIVGSDGNDVIDGGAGDDTIVVGGGANRLTGGAGHDLFVFRSGAARDNVITDFRVGEDMIDLAPVVAASGYAGIDALADRVLRVEQVGADAVISLDPDGTGAAPAHRIVTLKNVIASSLHDGHDFWTGTN